MMPLASKDGLYRNRKLSPLGGIANFLSLMEVIRVTTTRLTVSISRGFQCRRRRAECYQRRRHAFLEDRN